MTTLTESLTATLARRDADELAALRAEVMRLKDNYDREKNAHAGTAASHAALRADLAHALGVRDAAVGDEAMTDTEKRVEFERELAHLINRLSLECTFGNRPDFVLATLAWDALAATAETATPETPPVLVGSVDAFCRSQGYVPADDLRKVALDVLTECETQSAGCRCWNRITTLDLDAIIAKAVK